MIAKVPTKRRDGRSSFRQLVDYCTTKEAGQVLYVGLQKLSSPESAAVEMEALAADNVRCKDPVFHFILSWRETELPTPGQADQAVNIALKELDLQDCQALWALQADTENRHVHVVVNRIDPETGRAIQPAGNWTYKALERAARKIELSQGWEVERTGRYAVTEDGRIEAKETKSGLRGISQTARDIEAHTATKSAERVAREVATPIIRSAQSWEEMHRKLEEVGIAFERKGSGAVLRIGGDVVKASRVGRDLSLSKLTERFGEYREADLKEVPRSSRVSRVFREPEPVERAASPQVRGSWDRYRKARTEYFDAKKRMAEELRLRQQKERTALQREQKEERMRAFSVSWSGMGTELNRHRSVLAAMQQSAKLDLRDRQQREREESKKRFPHRFPNFKTWLEQEANPELSILFRYPDSPVFFTETAANPGAQDLRAYTPLAGNRGGVAYVRDNREPGKADFVDYGRKILLDWKCDGTAVLAALQLANQKWGAVQIAGTEEYKRLCVQVAIQHNLRIANPDLALEVEEGRKRMFERRIEAPVPDPAAREQVSVFERYAEAVGADRYRVVATEFTSEGVRAFVFDRRNGGLEGKTRGELSEALPTKLSRYADAGKNINVVPLSADRHHILIDDMTEQTLERCKKDGYAFACVIESSPGNFQGILTVPKLDGDEERDRQAANRLAKELNEQYGDPKLSGAVHAHRLPPFPNRKPKHRRPDGSYPATALIEAEGGICAKATERLKETRARLDEEALKIRREEEHRRRRQSVATGIGANDPNGAYWAHYRDIAARQKGEMDYSRIDAMIGIRMRVTGYEAGQVQAAIQENAPAMRKDTLSTAAYDAKYRNRDWKRFARETVEKFVFGPRGATQYAQAEAYRPYYMKLEGRSLAEKQRRERENRSSPEQGR